MLHFTSKRQGKRFVDSLAGARFCERVFSRMKKREGEQARIDCGACSIVLTVHTSRGFRTVNNSMAGPLAWLYRIDASTSKEVWYDVFVK